VDYEDSETEALLRAAALGDGRARERLLDRYRQRLRRMVEVRLDPRLDASDIVQEALADAGRELSEYLRDRPLSFYPWLYRLAADWLAQAHRHHLKAQARAVGRQWPGALDLVDEPARQLADDWPLRDGNRQEDPARFVAQHGEPRHLDGDQCPWCCVDL